MGTLEAFLADWLWDNRWRVLEDPDGAAAALVAALAALDARLALARDAWDAALLAGDLDAADRIAAEVAALEAATRKDG